MMNKKMLKYIVTVVLLLAVAITNINFTNDYSVASDLIWPHDHDNVIKVASDLIWPHDHDNVIKVASDLIWPHATDNIVKPNGTVV